MKCRILLWVCLSVLLNSVNAYSIECYAMAYIIGRPDFVSGYDQYVHTPNFTTGNIITSGPTSFQNVHLTAANFQMYKFNGTSWGTIGNTVGGYMLTSSFLNTIGVKPSMTYRLDYDINTSPPPASITCEACVDEKAAKKAECGPGNFDEGAWNDETCTGQCICPTPDDTDPFWELQGGDWTALIGTEQCDGQCKVTVLPDTKLLPKTDPDDPNEDLLSSAHLDYAGAPCSDEPPLPEPVPDPRDNCDQANANCMIECGGVNLVEKFECSENDPETGGTASNCECKEKISCEEEEAARAADCGGVENLTGFDCSMVGGIPVVAWAGSCIAPPAEKTCEDYQAACTEYCGPDNQANMGCRELSYGPQVYSPCTCENVPSQCPVGRVCPDDGHCQQGEDPASNDCSGDDDKDGCPNGEICRNDGKCQPGENKDSYDCGGNNDGNTNNDPGGNGESTGGGGTGTSGDPCPVGEICSGDGQCQPGESATASDCMGPGSEEEGEGGEAGTENGMCPSGSVCHGDGVCQAGEPSTAVDCAGLNYTSTRFAQMTAVIKGSDMLKPLQGFDIPSGGSSSISVNLGSVGGVKSFDFSKFSAVWAILSGLFTITACWVGVRIITLKR